MKSLYISLDDVQKSIDYFKENSSSAGNFIGVYLLAKKYGIGKNNPFILKDLDKSTKAKYLHDIWMLAGIFDSTEKVEDKNSAIIFPHSLGVSTERRFNAATQFGSSLLSRLKDSMRNFNQFSVFTKDEDDTGYYYLSKDYQDIIANDVLKGNKISLSMLAAWYYRFTKFEFEEIPSAYVFTKVIEKSILKDLRITKQQLSWIFENDFSSNLLTITEFNDSRGLKLREYIGLDDKYSKGIVPISSADDLLYDNTVDLNSVKRFISMNGDNPSNESIQNILNNKKQIILTGVPGVGKSYYTNTLKIAGQYRTIHSVQFHETFSYAEFIGGESLKESNGATEVYTRKGVLLDAIEAANSEPDYKHLLILDEINRGNISSIFGETILTLDRGYSVNLSKEIDGVSSLSIPQNLYIVGTMNTSDRNIAFLDLAIRRRFAFVKLLPNYELLSTEVSFENYDLGYILKNINQRIIDILNNEEYILGHAYFMNPLKEWDRESFKNQFNFVLIPTLQEYASGDMSVVAAIIGENLADIVDDKDLFFEFFNSEFMGK